MSYWNYVELWDDKSGYCKCSIAWCQVRPFLLFVIRTHPLQRKEYRLQYASTDKNKKSHYNTETKRHLGYQIWHYLHKYALKGMFIMNDTIQGCKIWWCALRYLGANLEVCVHRWVACMCKVRVNPPGNPLNFEKMVTNFNFFQQIGRYRMQIMKFLKASFIGVCSISEKKSSCNFWGKLHTCQKYSKEHKQIIRFCKSSFWAIDWNKKKKIDNG